MPSTVITGDRLTLEAFADDSAGNRTTAAQLTLVVGDAQAPEVTLAPIGSGLDVTPGTPVTIRVTGNDDAAIGQLRLTGTGPLGYAFDESRSTAPVSPASADFVVPIPATLADGETIALTARATDTAGNPSAAATLTLTARGLTSVTLPSSLLVRAGADEVFTVELGAPAPAGGLVVTFTARTAGIVQVPAPVTFAAGTTSQPASLRGVADGVTQLDARINGIVRQSMTVSVVGGVVRGTVLTAVEGQPGLQPVAGAQVTVFHGGPALVTTTDVQGRFDVDGVEGISFTVRAGEIGLLGYVAGTLDVIGGSAEATVVLLPAGTFTGTLVQSDGVTPVGANVEVTLAEAATPTLITRRERTDDTGRWRFDLVAPGPYVIEAADLAGNRARAVATAVAGTESNIPLAYLGRGTVTGIVRSGAGQPVVGATVELFASSLFGAAPMQSSTSDGNGRFSFAGVFVGDVTVRARDVLNQGGVAVGTITQAGQQLDLTVSLAAFGTLQGTVFRQDGTTPVPAASVTVRMTGGAQFTVATQTDGTYRFEVLPFQGYTVTARETATRGVGVASGAFGASGETRTLDVVLLPQGSVLVQVIGADGQPVNGASVTVTTIGYGLQDSRSGATTVVDGVAGRVLLDRLLEGSLTVDASAAGLSGRVTGLQLVRDTVTNVEVTLEPQATIAGRVFEADGVTPAGGTVTVYGANNFTRGLALVDGRFSTDLRLGTYALVAFDGAGRRRAIVQNIALTANAQVESRDLVYVAVGTVSGRVIHPSVGGDAGGLTVQLQSLHPDFGGFRSATTNAAGLYSVADVPYGVVRVNVAKSSESLQGESAGLLQAPTLSLDVLLQNNSVTLPVTLADVNDSSYSILSGGRLGGGTRSVFSSAASVLEIERDGVRTAFTGTAFATRELGGRQLVVREQGLQGLSVTRKAYVPVNGYFARYLEVMANPTDAPIVVNVHLTSKVLGWYNNFGGYIHHQVNGTSSGNTVLDVGTDRWATLDAYGNDGYYSSTGSSRVAMVFEGEGAADGADVLQFAPAMANNYTPGTFTLGWQTVTIPAGGQVSLLHFIGQQPGGLAAIAAAERLVTLPPEALDGLSAADIASVVNFAVPADGLSQVPALPPVTGTVSGRVLEGDGTTPVAGAQVRFRSSSPVHAREWFVSSGADGSFSFSGVPQRPVPVTGFSLDARHPLNTQYVVSPTATGVFGAGTQAATADVPFSNTGIIRAIVRNNGTPLSGVNVELVSYATRLSNAAGEVEFRGVPADQAMVLRGNVSHPQGTGLSLLAVSATIPAGVVSSFDLLVEPTGAVTGVLTNAAGVPQPNRQVVLYGGTTGTAFVRSTTTDSSGRFALPDVKVGPVRVRATDPASNFTTELAATVVQNQVTDVVLRYIGNGTITTTVRRANGTPLAGMRVQVTGSTFSRPDAITDASGVAIVTDIPLGQVATIRAYHPSNSTLQTSTTRTITAESGGQAAVSIALPAFGEITGLVRTTAGALVGSGVNVQLAGSGLGTSFSLNTSTDSRYTFGPIPTTATFTVDTYHPTARRPSSSIPRSNSAPQRLTADAQTIALDTFLPAIAALRVHVREANGAAIASARVQVRDTLSGTSFVERGTTDAAGDMTVPFVVEGPADIRVFRSGNSTTTPNEVASVPILRANDGQTVDTTIVVKAFTITLHGRVFQADGLTPLPNPYSVELLRPVDKTLLRRVCVTGPGCFPTGSSPAPGEFLATDLPVTGAGVLVRIFSPFGGSTFGTYEQLVVPTANGAIDVSIVQPFVTATFSGRVFASDGATLVTTGTVWPRSLSDTYSHFGSPLNASGQYQLSPGYVPIEGLQLRYEGLGLPSTGYAITTGPIAPTPGQALVFDLTLPPSVFTTVTGRLVAGDGTTPINSATVRVTFADGPCQGTSCSTSPNSEGRFSLPILLPASGEATLTATTYVTDSPTATRAIAQTAQGGTTDVGDILLPISVITGRVTFGATVPAPGAEVFARSATGQVTWANMVDNRYTLLGLKAGTYTLVASQYPSGLTTERQVVLAADDSVLAEDLQLAEVATVEVRLFRAAGQPFSLPTVSLRGPNGVELRCGPEEAELPQNGVCRFDYQPLGPYYAQGQWQECEEIYDEENDEYIESCTPNRVASGTTTLTTAGTLGRIDLYFDRDNTATLDLSPGYLAAGTRLRVTELSSLHGGPLGPAGRVYETVLPADMQLPVGPLPVGPVVVLIEYWQDEYDYWDAYARVEFAMPPATSGVPTIDAYPGNVSGENVGMYGDDRYYYSGLAAGQLGSAGYLDPTWHVTLFGGINYAGRLSVDHEDVQGWTVTGSPGRQAIYGPLPTGGPISVSRRLEVPQAGGHLYALDTFTNPTTVPFTIRVDVRNLMKTRVIAASTAPSVAEAGMLVYDSSANNEVSVGFLYAGVDAPLPPQVAFDAYDWEIDGNDKPRFTYTITIPAGASRSLLSFTSVDAPANSAAIEARLRAIAADPRSAAAGLSAAERARVVNFRLEP